MNINEVRSLILGIAKNTTILIISLFYKKMLKHRNSYTY